MSGSEDEERVKNGKINRRGVLTRSMERRADQFHGQENTSDVLWILSVFASARLRFMLFK